MPALIELFGCCHYQITPYTMNPGPGSPQPLRRKRRFMMNRFISGFGVVLLAAAPVLAGEMDGDHPTAKSKAVSANDKPVSAARMPALPPLLPSDAKSLLAK